MNASDLARGIHVVNLLQCEPEDSGHLAEVMLEDYRYLARNPAFLSGRVVESHSAAGHYFHITHWASHDELQSAADDPEIPRILGQLRLSAPIESHIGEAIVVAHAGSVYATLSR